MSQPNVLHAPWEADGYHVYDAYSVSVARVGTASRTFEDARQLARLIAAAPQLLDHARLLERSLVYEINKDRKSGDDEGARMKTGTLNAVRDTIASATGGAK